MFPFESLLVRVARNHFILVVTLTCFKIRQQPSAHSSCVPRKGEQNKGIEKGQVSYKSFAQECFYNNDENMVFREGYLIMIVYEY